MKQMRMLAPFAAALLLVWMIACGGGETPPEEAVSAPEPVETAKAPEPPPIPEPEPEVAPEPVPRPKAQPAPKKKPSYPVVVMETSKGTIKIELYPEKAPQTVANFLTYVDEGFYDGTIFHRVMEDFMIQGGGSTPAGQKEPTHPPIKNEARTAGLSNERGTIAMARTPNPHSATAQFFINTRDNTSGPKNLDPTPPQGWGYCVFGKVIDGLEVVDTIAATPVVRMGARGEASTPTETLTIKSVKRAS